MSKKIINKQKMAPYLFVAPFLLIFIFFSMYPLFDAFKMSFQEVNGFDDVTLIGLDNYARLIKDPVFYKALWNVLRYTFWTCLILIPFPMLVAIVMNHKGTPFKSFFRSLYFMPVLTSSVIIGIVFKFAFSKQPTGVFNTFLSHFGVEPINWLNGSSTGMFALIIICVWRWLGVNMIYFLSGLQGIPIELYESADVDGASTFQKFKSITVPLLKPITVYVLTISILAGFSLFNESYVYWGTASPNNIGTTLVTMIYKFAFEQGDYGYACALGVVMFLIVVTFNAVQIKLTGLFKEDN